MIESLTGQGINVRHACRVLDVSESGYYAWKDRPDPPRALRRIWPVGEIEAARLLVWASSIRAPASHASRELLGLTTL